MLRPALFLDRDGVINVDLSYVYLQKDFHFIEGIFELVSAANQAGYLVIVVTNQAGIGRGYYSEADFQALTDWMCDVFVQRGAAVDAVYYCPFHPEHGVGEYKQESEYRKPNPGMLLQAAKEHDIDLERSIMVGDKISDIQAGQRAGVGRLFYFSQEPSVTNSTIIRKLTDLIPILSSAGSFST